MFVGSFEGDFDGFQADVVQAVNGFKQAKITQVLIDLTNNGGTRVNVLPLQVSSYLTLLTKP